VAWFSPGRAKTKPQEEESTMLPQAKSPIEHILIMLQQAQESVSESIHCHT
jgi:hypothetical protein